MKKYLYFILVIACVVAITARASAVSEYDSDEKVSMGVIGTAGTGAMYELNPSKIFTIDDNFGQNLYENIHERVQSQGSDLAVSRSLSGKNISKEELFAILPGSNIGELLTRPDPKENLKPEDVSGRQKEFQQILAEEKILADMEVENLMEVESTEIFANGDEADSGFDLLVDLDVIDKILFGEIETAFGGGGPGAPAGSNKVGVGGGGGGEEEKEDVKLKEEDKSPMEELAEELKNQPSSEAAAGGFVCPANESFNSAAVKAIAKEKGLAKMEQALTGQGESGAAGKEDEKNKDGDKKELDPEPAADWSKPVACDKPFCLQIEAKYKTESSYLANENCIACHFEKINDAFKKTFQHNLVPSKATGNLIELPKCKRSFLRSKWNFIWLPQPILTPPNDDLIVKGDFIKNIVDFWKEYGSYDTKKIANRVINQMPDDADTAAKLREIKDEVGIQRAEAEKLLRAFRTESDAKNQSSQFATLMQEMDNFSAYFESFLQLYFELAEGDNNSPCKVLNDKPNCNAL